MAKAANKANRQGEPSNGWEARRVRTRQKLLEAATEMMAEGGEESISVSAVAKKAGVTRPGAYYHFENKDALIKAVKESLDDQVMALITGVRDAGDAYSFSAKIAAEDDSLIRLRIVEMLENGVDDILIAAFIEEFQKEHSDGHLQPDVDPEMAGIIASSSLVSGMLAVSEGRTKEEKLKLAKLFGDTYYQLLFNGVLDPEGYASWPEMPEYFEFES